MAEVLEINDPEELASHRLLWDFMLRETPRATFFHTYEWLATYWKHFSGDQKLRVLVVHSCGEPIGIVPLCVRREKYRVGEVRVLTYPLDNWGSWYGPIGPNQVASMMLAMQHIHNTPRDWDLIDLRWVGPAAKDGGRPLRAMRIAGLEPRKLVWQQNSVVRMDGCWQQFLDGKSAKLRHEYRRKLRKVFEHQDVEFIRHRPAPARVGDGDPRWDLFEMCQHIAAESWQGGVAQGNTLSTGRVREFLRQAHAEAARLGMVDINLLKVGGRPAAFVYNYHHEGRLFGLRTGYSPEYAGEGVGSAVLLKCIQDSFALGDESFDLGGGGQDFKRRLRTIVEPSYRLTHTPLASFKSQAVRLSQWAKHRLPGGAGDKTFTK